MIVFNILVALWAAACVYFMSVPLTLSLVFATLTSLLIAREVTIKEKVRPKPIQFFIYSFLPVTLMASTSLSLFGFAIHFWVGIGVISIMFVLSVIFLILVLKAN